MRRISRWPIFTAVVLVLALGGLTSLAIATVRTSFPETSGRLMVSGLKGQVEVLRDSYGAAHLRRQPEDLFQAQGYVHAQDRFSRWTSAVISLPAGSRNSSEYPKLETDAYIRTLGWRRVAERERRCSHRRLAAISTRTPLASTPTSRADQPPTSRWNIRCSGCKACATPVGVDGRRFDGLAQGHGLGSRHQTSLRADRAIISSKLGAGRAASLFPRYPLEDDFAPIVRRRCCG